MSFVHKTSSQTIKGGISESFILHCKSIFHAMLAMELTQKRKRIALGSLSGSS